MLSFTSGRKIAILNEDKKQLVYLKENSEDKEPEISTTAENRMKIFKNHLSLNKKLSHSEISTLSDAYKHNREVEGKLNRVFHNACEYVEKSLKRHLQYDSKTNIFPILDEPSYRIFVSGLSGSGKSYFISEFLKHNKLKIKGAGIFLFSPVQDDKALSKIKNLIHINIDDIEKEMKGKEFTIEDLPRGSVCIFDDVESFPKHTAKQYLAFRDICLERGRHSDISTITVSHNATNGHTTKTSIRESQYWVLFPKHNSRDTKNILKLYGGLDKPEIDEICSMPTRWVFYKKSVPKYCVGEHSIITFE